MTATNVRVQMQQRRDTAANWTSANPTLLSGELGYETDTNKFKIGNGTAAWSALAYVPGFSISAYPLATADIADDAITAAKIANTSVSAGSYTTADITVDAQGRITSAASGTIGTAGLADGAVTTAKLADDAVTGAKLANDITIANNLTVTNDLTVNGTTTTIDSTTLVVEDKNIEIGKVSTPTDLTADGGGITLKGATDKTLTWVDSTDCWTFNQGLNLTAGTAGAPALVFNGDVNSGLFQPGADSLAIATGGTQRITVDSSGRVGIGSTSPAANLDVLVNSASDSEIRVRNNTDGMRLMTQADGSSLIRTVFNRGLIFGSGTSNSNATFAERMRIDSSGRLLVGTTSTRAVGGSVGSKLQIEYAGGSGFNGASISATDGGATLFINNAKSSALSSGDLVGRLGFTGYDGTDTRNGFAYIEAYADGAVSNNDVPGRLVFSTTADGASSPTERLRIDSSGNVGIGTSSPQDKLHVNGTIRDSIGPLRRLGVNAQSGAYTFVVGDAGKIIRSAGSGAALTLNQNIFTAGDMISVFNVSGGNNTIVQGSGVTLHNTADAATGTRTVAAKGMVTIVCTASNEFAISGSQLT